jgi:GMP synthase-like glutamine amidotransferase
MSRTLNTPGRWVADAAGVATVRALVLQHDDDVPPALLDEWARERGLGLTVRHMRGGAPTDDPDEFQFAIVLGSEAHADDRAEPWVRAEIEWLWSAVERSLPILGICFGAQALAVALGGSVHPADRAEIAWISVHSDLPDLIAPGPWYSWHEDVIRLPPGAVEVARNRMCSQAYVAGPHLGLQFHPEITAALAAAWAEDPEAVAPFARAGVDPEAFARESERQAPLARPGAMRLFDAFAERVRLGSSTSRAA